MAAAGNGVVASNADSGNSIKMANVVGATVPASPIAATTAPSTLTPTRRRGNGCRERGRSGRSVDGVTPIALPKLRLQHNTLQPTADSQLRRMLQRQHR